MYTMIDLQRFTYVLSALPSVWSSLFMVNTAAFGTLVSFSIVILKFKGMVSEYKLKLSDQLSHITRCFMAAEVNVNTCIYVTIQNS